ncbi:MAG: YggS family pyridoxal phosphate-dependent enzyme [Terracidiphilus sp.]|nr:YggS family pyridoxal phosphate-dependent enzyme [Terracidiphilus sp.]
MLKENLERVEAQIAAACHAAGRMRESVELMAVSKTHPVDAIDEATKLGLTLFGENRVQEFALKALHTAELRKLCKNENVRVHLIGHLQSNKAARAAEIFDAVDSVDSLKLAERLNEAAGKFDKKLPILLEVKLSTEETKAGLDPASAEAAQLLERLPDFAHLEVQGLMTVAPLGVSDDETRACFRALRTLRDEWAQKYSRLSLGVLSMGMSGDFKLAIAEGATRIRIGSAIFDERSYLEKV